MAWNDFLNSIVGSVIPGGQRGSYQDVPPMPVPTPTPPMLPPAQQPDGISNEALLALLAQAIQPKPSGGGGGLWGGITGAAGDLYSGATGAASSGADAVGDVVSGGASAVGDAASWYYNTERNLLGQAYDAVQPVIQSGLKYGIPGAIVQGQNQLIRGAANQAPSIMQYLDKGRDAVVSDMGEQAYYMATHDGEIPDGGLSWDPYLTVSNTVGAAAGGVADLLGSDDPQGGYAFLIGWAKDPKNWEMIQDAYKNGYTQMIDTGAVDENGDPILVPGEYFEPGPRAVWEAYVGTTGMATRIAADMTFDPLNALGAVGKAGDAVQGAGRVIGGAEDASRARRAAGTALDVTGQLANVPNTLLNVPGEAVVGAVGEGAKQVAKLPGIKQLVAPSAATIRRREAGAVNEALSALRGTEAMDILTGTPGGSAVTSAIDQPIGEGVQAATQGIEQAATQNVKPRTFAPGWDAVPEYLRPTNEGERLIDILARDGGAQNPEGMQRFVDRYAPLAQKHADTQTAIDAKYRTSGKGRWVPEKTIAMARHIVDDMMPIARDELGDAPAYRFMNGDGLDEALTVVRDDLGKVTNWRDIPGMAPNASNVIEQAVFGTDDLAAANARLWMRRQPEKGWKSVANEAKRLRAELYGDESVSAGIDLQAKRAAKAADEGMPEVLPGQTDAPLPGLTQEQKDAKWMAEQEANALRAEGKEVPQDLIDAMNPTPITPEPLGSPDNGIAITSDPVMRAADPPPDGLDPALVDKGWHNPDTALYDTAMKRAVEVGDLDADQALTLTEKHLFNENGQRIKTPRPGREKTAFDASGNVIIKPATEQVTHEKSAIELYTDLLNSGIDANEARTRVVDMIGSAAGNRSKLRRALNAYDTASSFIREMLMFNPITGWRGIASDQIGDTWSLAQRGDIASAADSFRSSVGVLGKARKGAELEGYLAKTKTGQTIDKLGMATPSGIAVDVGREEVGRSGAMTLNRAVQKITGSERAGKVIGGAFQNEYIRDVRTALDRVRRFSTFGNVLERELPTLRDEYFDVLGAAAAKDGIDADAIIGQLGDAFDPRAVRQAAIAGGMKQGTAEQLARQWRTRVNQLQKTAMEDVNSKLFSYESTNADEVIKRTFLFHFWMSRASVQYMGNAIRNPRIALGYYRAAQGLENQSQGKPRAVQGFIKLMSGGAGYSLFFNPVALASTALLFRDQAYDDGDGSIFDKFIQNSGGFLNPLLQTALTASGFSDQSVDPTATYSLRSTLGGIVQWGVGNGYLEPVGVEKHYLGTPYQDLINRVFSMSSGQAAKVLPLVQQFTPDDPDGSTQAMIQADIVQQVRDAYELGDAPIDSWPAQAQQDYLDAVSDFQLGKSGNPFADQAVENYSNANVRRRIATTMIPGGVSMRSDIRDQTMMNASAGDIDAIQNRSLFNVGSPEAAALEVASQNYQGVGNDAPQIGVSSPDDAVSQGRLVNEQYNDIRFGTPSQISVGGRFYSPAELSALSPDDRQALADQWLIEQGGGADRQIFFDARDAEMAEPINAPYAAYQDWAKQAREVGMGPLMQASPAYRAYIEGLPDETKNDPNRLSGAAFSPDAYMASEGIKGNVFTSEIPQPLLDPTQVNPVTALSGGSSAEQGYTPKPREQQLTESIRDYQNDMAIFDQRFREYTGNPNASLQSSIGANPMLANALMANLRNLGIHVPSMPSEVQDYLDWSAAMNAQSPGADTSPAAFYRWIDSTIANQGVVPATAIP